ncbi:surfactant-like protein [Ranid herpesvirus 3]|uniref:Surfactant-like protein n=1 Tax=Ranid herpesvirus 3 TaxID=1987509 RepID=A0A1X9T576_9VIRU|nr:surfactant-like protein [Ranid herpesvirus 3]ARR28853.1 surfactant-like protein [Ranid herpesvirus 3]
MPFRFDLSVVVPIRNKLAVAYEQNECGTSLVVMLNVRPYFVCSADPVFIDFFLGGLGSYHKPPFIKHFFLKRSIAVGTEAVRHHMFSGRDRN